MTLQQLTHPRRLLIEILTLKEIMAQQYSPPEGVVLETMVEVHLGVLKGDPRQPLIE